MPSHVPRLKTGGDEPTQIDLTERANSGCCEAVPGRLGKLRCIMKRVFGATTQPPFVLRRNPTTSRQIPHRRCSALLSLVWQAEDQDFAHLTALTHRRAIHGLQCSIDASH